MDQPQVSNPSSAVVGTVMAAAHEVCPGGLIPLESLTARYFGNYDRGLALKNALRLKELLA